jgi:hypothetical protein
MQAHDTREKIFMSEETKTTPAVPAESPRVIEAPLTSFVRGGTITSAYERDLQAKKADAERRRKEEDARHRIAAKDPVGAKMGVTKLGGAGSHAAIVLEIRNSDDRAEEFIVCELTLDRENDPPRGLMLIMCCPRCSLRVTMAEAQMTIRSWHRKFELDTRRAGELWVNPKDPREFVHLAGTIQLTEATTCPGLGCGWRFKIDNSVVKTL